jgi:CRP-like cAMP-binding protein
MTNATSTAVLIIVLNLSKSGLRSRQCGIRAPVKKFLTSLGSVTNVASWGRLSMSMALELSSLAQEHSLRERIDGVRIAADDLLFAPGAEKQFFYWIDEGQIELHWSMQRSTADRVERLGSGDYFGLGFLAHYAFAAIAVTDARLQRLPRAAAKPLAEIDARLRERDAIENQREFAHRREMMIAAGSQPLPQRLATFLGVLSRFNAHEGREPLMISDDIAGRVVADYLATDIAALGQALRQLSDLGAIELVPPHGLRIRDLDFLEYIADRPAAILPNMASEAKTVPPPLPRHD